MRNMLESLMAGALIRGRPDLFPGEARPDRRPVGARTGPAPPPAEDPLDYVRRAAGFEPGGRRDLALCMARALGKMSSIARYRQALALAAKDPALAADVARAFREALAQSAQKPGLYFDFALLGLIPSAQKTAPPDCFAGPRAGQLGTSTASPLNGA
jgi:hypothetical protein